MEKSQRKKSIDEMTNEEISNYHHTPETELSLLVCQAAELEEYADLKDYLQLMSDCDLKKINERDGAGMTALHCAVARNSLPAITLLLKFGAVVDCKDKLGFTPLFLATGRYPNSEIALYLLKTGKADVNMVTNTGATPLHGASLQGNFDCIKILLEHGADPRAETEDGTTSFDLAKNDAVRSLLHEALIEKDQKQESEGAVCCQCKQAPAEGLKRCSQCHVTMYCSRDCQIQHWKHGGHRENCSGFVLARPHVEGANLQDGRQMSFYKVMGSNTKNIKVFSRNANEAPGRMEFLRNKRFVVKVQIPICCQGKGDLMVYNADRTAEGFILPSEKGYSLLADKIRKEGFMGIKGFFWAELTGNADGTFKVFHGKLAPFQKW